MMADSRSMFDKVLESLKPQDARQWQELKNADWMSVHNAVIKLFQLRRYPDLAIELPLLNEKLNKLSKSEIGPFIGDFYQDQILKKCMIILRHELVEEKGDVLLRKLAETWTQFYTSILPTLQAIFAPVQLERLSIRALTLISFRDVVLLKTHITGALDSTSADPPPEIRQMLLVLQSVHHTPPSDQFYTLQSLVGRVVDPYLCMVPKTKDVPPTNRSSRAETISELDSTTSPLFYRRGSGVQRARRHSLGGTDTT